MTDWFVWFAAGVVVTNMVWTLIFILDTRRSHKRMREQRR
jgi:hypothetical protein